MKKIALISCGSKKLNHRAEAQHIYISPLFKKSLAYAKKIHTDSIYILSAKHHLLELTKEITPYDKTLNKMTTNQIKQWSDKAMKQINNKCDTNKDRFIILAGIKYRKYLIPHLSHYKVPMQGLRIGEQLQYLNKKLGIKHE